MLLFTSKNYAKTFSRILNCKSQSDKKNKYPHQNLHLKKFSAEPDSGLVVTGGDSGRNILLLECSRTKNCKTEVDSRLTCVTNKTKLKFSLKANFVMTLNE